MGTSLALTGAYLLAGELSRTDDHRAAFAGYERVMRPHVDRAQQLPPEAPRLPRTERGIRALHAGVRLMTTPPGRYVLRGLMADRAELDLPRCEVGSVRLDRGVGARQP